jgi:hypothetical protein
MPRLKAEGMSGPRVGSSAGGAFNIVHLTLFGLKLAGVISWPWSMVLFPVWFGLGSLSIIALGIGVAGERVALLMRDWRGPHPVRAVPLPAVTCPGTRAGACLGPVLAVPEVCREGPGHRGQPRGRR